MKIGIFGGSFNPPHNGHINSITTVQKKLGFDKIYIVVNHQNPLKAQTEGPTSQERISMTQKAFETYGNKFIVDDIEVKRGGASYTIDTIKEYKKKFSNDDLYFILGADLFEQLGEWKDYKKILSEVNLVVTTRPGFLNPENESELPSFLKGMVEQFDFSILELNTGKNIQFITLKDLEISSTELRKWLRTGKIVNQYLPLAVENYINEHKLYRNLGHKIGDFKKFTEFCADVANEHKGINIKKFDLTKLSAPSEYALIVSGTSTRHASALAENIARVVKEEYNVHPQGIEGVDEGRWVVLDYGSLIVHVFYDFVRQEYSLENMWKEAVELK